MRARATTIATFGVFAISLTAVTPTSAQDISAVPTYETIELSAGFSPDPQVRTLTAGGSHRTTLGGCEAHIYSSAPDFDLNYVAGGLPLIISASSESDVLLLVNTPDGRWHCDDDSGDGLDPMLTFSSPQSGNYNIWVGTYANRSGDLPSARLYISELRGGNGGNGGSGSASAPARLSLFSTPTYGSVELRSGFSPDPYGRVIRAGGPDEVPDIGSNCRGYVNASAPDLNLEYSAGSFPLHIYARSDTDVTLVINRPDGSWACSDDANGSNPHVRMEAPRSGTYNIWIGTYSSRSGTLPEATLYISEMSPDW